MLWLSGFRHWFAGEIVVPGEMAINSTIGVGDLLDYNRP